MPRIDFKRFRDETEARLVSKKCPIKISIADQMRALGKPAATPSSSIRRGGYARYADAAMILTGLHWEGDADQLIKDLKKGQGSSAMALALWYWLYCHANRRPYAEEVTKAAKFDIKHFDRHFQTDPDDDLVAILKRSVEPQDGIGPLLDVKILGQFLENFLTEQHTDPCLMILLNEMEKLLQPKTVLRDGERFSLRTVVNRREWIDPDEIEGTPEVTGTWTYRGSKVFEMLDGELHVLIRDDGTRVSSNSLHRINSWLISVWALHMSGAIPTNRLDLLLRYIIVLCSCGRSKYLQFYCNDDAHKLIKVFREAALRAHDIGMDTRDYGRIDAPYDEFFMHGDESA